MSKINLGLRTLLDVQDKSWTPEVLDVQDKSWTPEVLDVQDKSWTPDVIKRPR
jgi:hypothetical protein